uniref:Transposon MuDR mudrA n=1 Tax=Elaeophora elaphi TaxID=1147741 RepID=A0A0R3RT00_9BILA
MDMRGESIPYDFQPWQGEMPGNRANQFDERIRLPTGQKFAQIHKNEEVADGDNGDVESIGADGDDELINQLDDVELAILARIVQSQLDRYDTDIPVDEYQIVKLPRSSVRHPISPYAEGIGDTENELTMLTDDQPKITLPVIELPEDEIYEIDRQADEMPKYVLMPSKMIAVPSTVIENELVPIDDDALDDLELRSRIAVIADALNERATRGL